MDRLEITQENLMEFLTAKRMCSVENLSLHFGLPALEAWPLVKMLGESGKVRIARKSCGSSCASCAGCDSSQETEADLAAAIVISLTKKESDDECADGEEVY